MGANYSTSYVDKTVENFLNSQPVGTGRLQKYNADGTETSGYHKLKMYLKQYVNAIEFLQKNPTQLNIKMNEIASIRSNIEGLMIKYNVTNFSYKTKYTDIEDQIAKQMYAMNTFGRKRRSSKKRASFGKWSTKYKRSINCKKPKGFSQKQYCKYSRKK